MNKEQREVIGDWLIVLGALMLFVSLFLTWSHQLSGPLLAVSGASQALSGVPRDPTAWQVYSAVDVLLALLAAGLFGVALIGSRPARIAAAFATGLALVFVIHAAHSPPSNGVANVLPTLSIPAELRPAPTPGAGVAVAIVALGLGLGGLLLSFTAD